MIVKCPMKIEMAFRSRAFVDLRRFVSVTYMLTFPIPITIRISDVQTDLQIVPVDSDSVISNCCKCLPWVRHWCWSSGPSSAPLPTSHHVFTLIVGVSYACKGVVMYKVTSVF